MDGDKASHRKNATNSPLTLKRFSGEKAWQRQHGQQHTNCDASRSRCCPKRPSTGRSWRSHGQQNTSCQCCATGPHSDGFAWDRSLQTQGEAIQSGRHKHPLDPFTPTSLARVYVLVMLVTYIRGKTMTCGSAYLLDHPHYPTLSQPLGHINDVCIV